MKYVEPPRDRAINIDTVSRICALACQVNERMDLITDDWPSRRVYTNNLNARNNSLDRIEASLEQLLDGLDSILDIQHSAMYRVIENQNIEIERVKAGNKRQTTVAFVGTVFNAFNAGDSRNSYASQEYHRWLGDVHFEDRTWAVECLVSPGEAPEASPKRRWRTALKQG